MIERDEHELVPAVSDTDATDAGAINDPPDAWARPDGLDVGDGDAGDDDPDELARWLADAEDEAAGIAGREEH